MRLASLLAMLTFSYIMLFTLSLSIGVYKFYTPLEIIAILEGYGSPVDRAVVELRLWRGIAATTVGIGLAVSGLVIQRLLGNPLADPYILGVSPGAALSYVIALLLGLWGPLKLLLTFLGGLLAYSIVVLVASMVGLTSLALIIAGVALSYVFSSLSIIAITMLGPELGLALSWLFGTVAYTYKDTSLTLTIVVLASLAFIAFNRGALTALLLGEEVSRALGVNVRVLRLSMTATVALTVSLITAVSGPIGFIGLTAPWIARILVGADFTRLLLITTITGAMLGLGSDVIVRLVGGGRELPLTAITALLGAPLLFYLAVRGRHVGGL